MLRTSSLCLVSTPAMIDVRREEWVVPTGMLLQPPLVAAGPIIRASSRRSFSSAPTTAPLASREPLLEVTPGSPSIPVDELCCIVLVPGFPATLGNARAPSERSHRPDVPAARGGGCSATPWHPWSAAAAIHFERWWFPPVSVARRADPHTVAAGTNVRCAIRAYDRRSSAIPRTAWRGGTANWREMHDRRVQVRLSVGADARVCWRRRCGTGEFGGCTETEQRGAQPAPQDVGVGTTSQTFRRRTCLRALPA
jgi:hypothetical protein